MEVIGLFPNQQRPADILLSYYLGSNSKACDVTIVSPHSSSLFSQSINTPNYAMNLRYKQKESKYKSLCNKYGLSFQPLVFDCFGNIHEDTHKIINVISQRIYGRSGYSLMECLNYVYQRISIVLQKVTAERIIKRTAITGIDEM